MTFAESLNAVGVNTEAREWQFAIKQLYINLSIDTNKLDCIGAFACRFAQKSIRGTIKISERDGYVVGTSGGLLIVCPAVDDMPVTIMLDKKLIRVVESDFKFIKASVNVKTNDELYEFRVPKKQIGDTEKLINKVRSK